jgi:hypothetical protein
VETGYVLRGALSGVLFFLLAAAAQQAQSADTKQPPRLPPSPSQTAQIPNGVDTGTTQTNGSMPLGTPVPPNGVVGPQQRTRSAAARAAARPDPLTRTGAPLATPAPVVGEAVAREAAGKAASAPKANATVRSSTGTTGDAAAFRKSMSQCSALAKRSDRAACISQGGKEATR